QRKPMRRTGGFFVTASRFRAAELEYYVAEIGAAMSQTSTRTGAGQYPAPIVHLHQPQSASPPWQAIAAFSVLALQCLLMALIAWRVLVPPNSAADSEVATSLDKVNTALTTAEARRSADLAETRAKARAEFLDEAFRE